MADEAKQESVCAFCKSTYTFPRILDCFHVFCTPCLEIMIEKGKEKFKCPLCRRVLTGNVNSFKSYPFPDFLTNEKATNKQSSICQMCEAKELFAKCIDCDQNMCRECYEYHLKHKTFRSHSIGRLVKDIDIPYKKRPHRCMQHANKFCTYYCKPCHVLICENCDRTSHMAHKTQPIKSMSDAMRAALKATIEGVKSKLHFISKFIDNTKSEKNKYLINVNDTQNDMTVAASNLKEVLCRSVDMVLAQNIAELDRASNNDKKQMETFINSFERDEMSFLKLLKTLEDTEKYANDEDILILVNSMFRQISLMEDDSFQSKLEIAMPKYNPGRVMKKTVEEFTGCVTREKSPTIKFDLQFPILETPQYPQMQKFRKVTSISCKNGTIHIFADSDDTVLNIYNNFAYRVVVRNINQDGSLKCEREIQTATDNLVKIVHVCRHLDLRPDILYVWINNEIQAIEFGEKTPKFGKMQVIYRLPGEKEGVCCYTRNMHFLIFVASDCVFFEFDTNGSKGVRTFRSQKDLSKAMCSSMLITVEKFIMISTSNSIFTFDMFGELKQTFNDENADFRELCQDKCGNIFVADFRKDRICLLKPNGTFSKEVLTSVDGIRSPKSLTIDQRGNILVLLQDIGDELEDSIFIFSYL